MMRALIILALLFAPCLVFAQGAKPWATGIAQADQDRANTLFAEANALFAQQAHALALEKYQAALAVWDHPLIEFNAAVTLIRLDRPLEAADAIEKALRFGQAPFTAAEYAQVLDYQALVKGRVGEIEATCNEARGRVILDGKPWFDCPGTRKQRVLAGEHTLSGEHDTLLSRAQHVDVRGGAVARADIAMVKLADAYTTYYPHPRWVGWTAIAVGVVASGLGVGVYQDAADRQKAYEQRVASSCAVNGCDPESPLGQELLAMRDSAAARSRIATGLFIGGGVTLTASIVYIFVINRAQRRPVKIDARVSANGAAAQVSWRF